MPVASSKVRIVSYVTDTGLKSLEFCPPLRNEHADRFTCLKRDWKMTLSHSPIHCECSHGPIRFHDTFKRVSALFWPICGSSRKKVKARGSTKQIRNRPRDDAVAEVTRSGM